VDEGKIIEIRKTVGGGNVGYHRERDTQLHCIDKGKGEGSDGGGGERGGYGNTRRIQGFACL